MRKKRILVTGNKGYIGSVLTTLLLEKNYDVIGFDTGYYSACNFLEEPIPVKQITKDIRTIDTKDLEGIDGIIHLAGLSNDPLGEFDPELTYDINYKASVKLAKLAKSQGIKRFVFASSQSIYGISGDDLIDENATLNPITSYAQSKIMVEEEVSKLADSSFTPVFLRPSTVYGISPRLRLDIVLNNLVASAVTTEKIHILSDGSPWRPVIHVEDISKAFIAAVEAPADIVSNQAFNVGEFQNYQVRDIAQLIQDYLPKCEITFATDFNSDERSYKVDSRKIRTVLKDYFFPTWDIKKGIKQLDTAYRKAGLTYSEFKGYKFIRLNKLKKLIQEKKLNRDLFWTV